jgi:hypothetical protein
MGASLCSHLFSCNTHVIFATGFDGLSFHQIVAAEQGQWLLYNTTFSRILLVDSKFPTGSFPSHKEKYLSKLSFIYYHIIVVLGAHCHIYKSAYNVF